MSDASKINLSGKDWLTVIEAAHYCGVSDSQFRRHAEDYGLIPRRFMGKQLYSRSELFDAIDRSRPWNDSLPAPNMSAYASILGNGRTFVPNLSSQRLRPFKPRKKRPTTDE